MLDYYYPSRAALLAAVREWRQYSGPAVVKLSAVMRDYIALPSGAYVARKM